MNREAQDAEARAEKALVDILAKMDRMAKDLRYLIEMLDRERGRA